MIGAGIIATALVVGLLIAVTVATDDSNTGDGIDFAEDVGGQSPDLAPEMFDGFGLGDRGAPLTLTVFEDFQCPFCIRYSAIIEPVIIKEFVASGRLRLEFRNFPILGPESGSAAVASVCAARENRFWDYAAAVFGLQAAAGQMTDEQLNVGRLDDGTLTGIARDLGLDGDAFESCMASGGALAEVQAHIDEAAAFNVPGTSSFVLNGAPISRPPSDAAGLRDFLDEQLATLE